MVKRLCALSGIDIRVVSATTASALPIARQLRRGGVVATMLDMYVDSTLSLDAPLFNRPAANPAGIFQLAVATGAPIVPVCVVTNARGGRSVEIDSILSPGTSPMELAVACNQRIEAMVRRHPSTWSVWASLVYRWQLASDRADLAASQVGTLAA